MKLTTNLIVAAIAAGFEFAAGPGALAQTTVPTQTQAQAQERVYGSQLMTSKERSEYQQRTRELKTQEERDQFRQEHHVKMQERATERGVKLPDEPPAQGAGPRAGTGGGPGTGGGKGR